MCISAALRVFPAIAPHARGETKGFLQKQKLKEIMCCQQNSQGRLGEPRLRDRHKPQSTLPCKS